MDNPLLPVITYWEGPRPAWIDLCLKTAARHVPNMEIFTAWKWRQIYDESLGPWERIGRQMPNVQSDLLRAWYLFTFGGIWMDADCIVFRDFAPLAAPLDAGKDLIAYQVGINELCSALIGAKRQPDRTALTVSCSN